MASTLTVDNIEGATSSSAVKIPGHVIQVVQKIDKDITTITNSGSHATFVTCGNLSQSFTPKSNTSKVYLSASVWVSAAGTADRLGFFKFGGGNAADGVANAASNRTRALAGHYFAGGADATQISFEYLDSPATASAITYSVQFAPNYSSGNFYINRYNNDVDYAYIPRLCSTLTLMEIAQ